MTGNIDGLLSVSVAEGDKGVDFPPVLVFKEVRQVLKLFHALVADRADRPVLFRNVHSLRRSRFVWPLVFLRAGVTCEDAMPLRESFQGNSSWKILDGVGLVSLPIDRRDSVPALLTALDCGRQRDANLLAFPSAKRCRRSVYTSGESVGGAWCSFRLRD